MLLKLKIGPNVMLTINLDIQDCLISYNQFAQGSTLKVYEIQ